MGHTEKAYLAVYGHMGPVWMLAVVFEGYTMHMSITAWHPIAWNVLFSAGCNNVVLGCLFCSACKDKSTCIIHPQWGTLVVKQERDHKGAIFLVGGKVFTTSFSHMSEWQLALWGTENFEEH
ncbi:hypothetical protein A6R68_11148, partial [Neotoma lepida]